ncbi:sensor domain-containing diguanylate cyclase [Deefgea rivuli]|uniref:sensor domain-containing diguanylate cyclase n=1 Tax=Deefgea rivuli TaxID=400948 RepID=UPI000683FF14|nr:sensor domain-containing diguanylate cyclase [Deefgea rivuli]
MDTTAPLQSPFETCSFALLDQLSVAAWVKDIQLNYVWRSQAWQTILESVTTSETSGQDADYLPRWIVEHIQFEEFRLIARLQTATSELELQDRHGQTRIFRIHRSCLFDDQGELTGLAGFAIEVSAENTLRKELQTLVSRQANWFRALQDHALITMLDRQGRFTYVSEQFARLTGNTAKAMLGRRRIEFGLLPFGMETSDYLTLAEQGNPVTFEFTGTRSDGSSFWARSLLIALQSPQSTEQIFFELATDLTSEKQSAVALGDVNNSLIRLINENTELIAKLEVAAHTDPLTGLLNRRALYERADQEIDRAKRSQKPLSVIMMDIDHFKKINDTYGHEVGDQALLKLAIQCLKTLRSTDLMARAGGEEFVILLPDTDLAKAQEVAERLRVVIENTQIQPPAQAAFHYTISQGVAQTLANETLNQVMVRADSAMYTAKKSGRNQVCIANSDTQ